jgi:hypothetical protein
VINSDQGRRFSFVKQVILHLLPGLLVAAAYGLVGAYFFSIGLPSILAFYVSTVLVLLPSELGIMLFQARKDRDRHCWKDIVLYREKLPLWQLTFLVIVLLAWSALVFVVTRPILADPIRDTLFSWLPEWFDLGHYLLERQAYTQPIVIMTWLIGIFLGALVVPIVEEIYFRGYLLPRLSWLKGWAPLIGAILFSIYHFWSPWMVLSRIIAILPMVYAVWWKRNVYIGVVSHILLNLIGGSLMTIPLVFG